MAKKKRTPWVWLVLAALLLGVGAWVMRGAEPPERPPAPEIRLPTRMNREESKRADDRRTWVVQVVDAGDVMPSRPRDPVLALMPSEVKEVAVVAEFNAIMNSELGPQLKGCLFGEDDGPFMASLRDAGVDPLQVIDRVAAIDDTMVLSGDFKNADIGARLPKGTTSSDYGLHAKIYRAPQSTGGQFFMGTWRDQMLVMGENEAQLKASLDRLDGSGGQLQGKPVLDESMAYGDVYGVIKSSAFTDLIGKEDPALATLVNDAANQMQLHMDVGHDLGMVADVDSTNPAKAEELRRALGGALSLARMRAEAKGDTEQAEILDLAKVQKAEGGQFRLEAGLPNAFMKKVLEQCIENRKKPRKEDIVAE